MLVHNDGRIGVNFHSRGLWRKNDLLNSCSSAANLMQLYVSVPSVVPIPVILYNNVTACADRFSVSPFPSTASSTSGRD